jgi:phosphoglycolate phosphatase (TIGR01487 family)
MRYVAIASDYDGTLAHHGLVSDETIVAIQRLRQSGRKLILVTGRVLADLESVFSHFDLVDCIVAENGAVMYTPATRERLVLAPPPKQSFLDELKRRGVQPVGVGEAIVATCQPNETKVLEVIRDLGLDLQVIFNKGAVMVLPSGINKNSGLQTALASMGVSEHNVVAVGDAENDHAFLQSCEFSVAVANAHRAVKDTADLVTKAGHGEGVVELVAMILNGELAEQSCRARTIPVGREGQREFYVPAYGRTLLVAGASGSGKSTFVAGVLEMLIEKRYQVCLIDPEGDYHGFPGTIPAGDEKHAPSADEILQILQTPPQQVVVNLVGLAVADRPAFLGGLLPRLQELRQRMGRPHWIIIDEAHHMLSSELAPAPAQLAGEVSNLILITVHPERLAPAVLGAVDSVFAVGPQPGGVMEAFAATVGMASPSIPTQSLGAGQTLAWFPATGEVHCLDFRFSHAERKRHMRNYALGELPEDRSFYFRGPEQKLNLRAHNLTLFLQIAAGLDDETWLFHLKRADYSKWFREGIKDESLADEVAQYERDESLAPGESRERIRAAVERRYTAAP